jgi:anti-sigma factor ChrR (cupin superfamily)
MTVRSNRIRALLIILAVAATVGEAITTYAADDENEPPMLAIDPRTLKFEPIPDMPSCASGATLRGNPRNSPSWVMLKLSTGCRVPWHWHSAHEDLVVISGQGMISMKDGPPLKFTPGAYASLPSHHAHQANCTRECLIFAVSDGAFDINYVDENGEDISVEKALGESAKPKGTKK